MNGRPGFLRVSCFVALVEGKPKLRLLTPYPLEDVAAAESPAIQLGSTVPEKILPVGTRVRLVNLEFPTAAVEARRELGKPRGHAWLQLKAEREPIDRSFVVVLHGAIASADDAISAVEQVVSWEPMEPSIAGYMEPARRAIDEKRIVPGMDTAGVLMSWGWPDEREIVIRDAGREETWTYSAGRRRVLFGGGRVSRTVP
jgi:hypothetical protein